MILVRILFLFSLLLLGACKQKAHKPIEHVVTKGPKKDSIPSAIYAACFKGVDTSKKSVAGGCKSVFLYKYFGKDSILKILMDWDKAKVDHRGQIINLENDSVFKAEVEVYSKKIPENQVRANNICTDMYFVNQMKPEVYKIKRGTLCVALDRKPERLPIAYAWLKNAVFVNNKNKKQLKFKELLFWGVETGSNPG